MPFVSQKQRGLFHAAENDPAVAAAHGMKPGVVKKMIGEDQPGKLPTRVSGGKPAGKLPTFGASKPLRR